MNNISLTEFNEILLNDDIKYLRFIDEKNNRLYMIEDYNQISLDEKVESLKALTNINEVKNYFIEKDPNVNIFEFIPASELKCHLDSIRKMDNENKKKLTAILQASKNLKIKYINFTYFFIETVDHNIYYTTYNKKTDQATIRPLKILSTIYPTDYKKILRDIKTYQAFKYQNRIIKYDDIKKYIENPLLSYEEYDKRLIDGIRKEIQQEGLNKKPEIIFEKITEKQSPNIEEFSKKNTVKKIDKTNPEDKKETINHIINDIYSVEKIEKNNNSDNKKEVILQKEVSKTIIKENKPKKKTLLFYCLVSFSAGVILAAITILIGSFI